jgi:ABC-type antimicrobial peptide transport system permease subunit
MVSQLRVRQLTEEKEESFSPYAARSKYSKGRLRDEAPCPIRTAFQRDRDRWLPGLHPGDLAATDMNPLAFNLFMGLIGSFTLAVGGIGVANIMYIVVQERIKEIGVKRAVGAKRTNILFQFFMGDIPDD